MADVTVKLSDGTHEIHIEVNGLATPALKEAEETATRLFSFVKTSTPADRPTGFGTWALGSDTERSPEE